MAELYKRLVSHFNTFHLGVAGRLIYYDEHILDKPVFILAVHTTGADKTKQVADVAWEGLPPDIKRDLEKAHIGFAVRQI